LIVARQPKAPKRLEDGRMPAHQASPIELSAEQERARIILSSAAGLGIDETARRLGIWRKTAGHWRRRWREAATSSGVAALMRRAALGRAGDIHA
jgi:hypothetical protein